MIGGDAPYIGAVMEVFGHVKISVLGDKISGKMVHWPIISWKFRSACGLSAGTLV